MKKIIIALALIIGISIPAQAVGVSFAVIEGSIPFDFPIVVTPTGIQVQYLVTCIETSTRFKAQDVVQVDIPDGTPLTSFGTIITSAIVSTCSRLGVTVANNRAFFSAFTQGQ